MGDQSSAIFQEFATELVSQILWSPRHKPCLTSEQRQVSNFLRTEHSGPAGIPLLSVFFPFPDSLLTSLNVYLICFNACSLEPANTSSLLYTFI